MAANPVILSGALTYISLLTTVILGELCSRNKVSTTIHKYSAYLTLLIAVTHVYLISSIIGLVFRITTIFGQLTIISLIITFILGIMFKKGKINLVPHRRLGYITLILATVHVSLVLRSLYL